ncbi:DegQ family serine endoprotease [Opitutus terrae]|uniref:Protease Do n=1 Tax=Opitutus terrae (strain DSM 11246 / JCM 15787 / PB90-1) TaxID=452637 RepID=B1ZVS4_OPITP|nr:DegQ family serine endoprotease [Opitutus terrae]ACB75010.1 protease Do [Opitutus terrae PB90-1]
MNTRIPSSRAVLFALGLLAAGGLGWTASNAANPSVSVKVDERPISASVNSPLGASYAPIVKRVAPSVVKVLVTERAKAIPAQELPPFFNHPGFREFFGDQFGHNFGGRRGTLRQPPQEGLGSGVIVSPDGYILTNSHVVKGADTIKVTFGDGRELTAKVVGTDPQTDLAVIKVEAKDLPAITFADSDSVEVGDRVLAVGNPFGIGQTVTSGMVSGLGRAMFGLDYEDFIQTDAAINPGNSGGALVDAEGRLIGVNTAILSRSGGFQGIGFAIPSNLARNVMEQLASTGKVVRGYLGVTIQDITAELAEHFDLPNRAGALVAEVQPDSPAAKAGLKGGDVVTKIDGKAIKDARNLKLIVGSLKPGEKVTAEVLRDGKTQTMELSVTARPNERSLSRSGGGSGDDDDLSGSAEDTGTLNGVGVGDLDADARREFDIPANVRGALITSVEPDSAAAEAGLQAGNVILEINRKPVKNAEDAVKLTEKTESKKTLVRLWTPNGIRYVVVDETDEKSGS